MSFIPLVIWAIGWLYLTQYEKDILLAHKQDMSTYKRMLPTFTFIWVVGIVFFLWVGFNPVPLIVSIP